MGRENGHSNGATMDQKKRHQRRLAIAAAVREGESIPEVAKRYGVSTHTVYQASRSGRPRKLKKGRPNVYAIIGRLCSGNEPFSDLAKEFRVSRQYVHAVFQRADKAKIPVRARRTDRFI
ncbi:MAG: helix-turn-helix domain-containing protein [Planctomycetes bacterium]|nr:helix-turn-helix domain-containing protein [Planctomycetota bacterium]